MALRDRAKEDLKEIPWKFPRELRNFRRGTDVPRGGESKGMPSLKFPRLILEIPSRIWERRGEGGANGLKRRNPRTCLVRGVFIPQQRLSVVLTGAWYCQGFKKIEPESAYRYYRRSVGSTGVPSVVSIGARYYHIFCRIPTVSSYQYYRPCVGSTVVFQNSNSERLSVLPTLCR
jgi:hypothetical protein